MALSCKDIGSMVCSVTDVQACSCDSTSVSLAAD